MVSKCSFLDALTTISNKGYDKVRHTLRRGYGYNVTDYYSIIEYINQALPRSYQYNDIIPNGGFRDVLVFERTIETLYHRGLTKGLSLKYLKSACNIFRRLEARIIISNDTKFRVYMRAVLRGTMKLTTHMILLHIDDRCALYKYLTRSFKICYTLFRSDLPYNDITWDTQKTWMKVFVIVGNSALKRKTQSADSILNQVRVMTDIMPYLRCETYLESTDYLMNIILNRSSSVITPEMLSEYKDYATIAWMEYLKYKEAPNWY